MQGGFKTQSLKTKRFNTKTKNNNYSELQDGDQDLKVQDKDQVSSIIESLTNRLQQKFLLKNSTKVKAMTSLKFMFKSVRRMITAIAVCCASFLESSSSSIFSQDLLQRLKRSCVVAIDNVVLSC